MANIHRIYNRAALFVVGILILFFLFLMISRQIDHLLNPPTKRVADDNTLLLQNIWTTHFDDPLVTKPVWDDSMIVLFNDEHIRAIENESGDLLWEYNHPQFVTSELHLALDKNLVVAIAKGGELIALNANNGELVWSELVHPHFFQAPDILIIDDLIVTAQSIGPGANTLVSIYDVTNGDLIKSIRFQSRSYSALLHCPSIPLKNIDVESTVCIIFYETILVMDVDDQTIIEELTSPIALSNDPIYQDGYFFDSTVDSPKSQIFIFDAESSEGFTLLPDCGENKWAYPVFKMDATVLVANGCDQVYVHSIDNLKGEPILQHNSTVPVASSFVSLDEETGYYLDRDGIITGIDLTDGTASGEFTTLPEQPIDEFIKSNQLYANPPYLYAIIDEVNMFVFRE